MNLRKGPAGRYETFEAILRNPELYALADGIPKKARGRKRMFPEFMWLFFQAAVSECGSARQVEAELNDPRVWRWIRHTVKSQFPDDPSKHLPETPMRRYHYDHARKYLADPEILKSLQQIHRVEAVAAARSIGLLDPEGEGSFTHPDLSRVLHGDGKAVRSIFDGRAGETRKDTKTGKKVPYRHDPDASDHKEGGDTQEYGTKFFMVSARSDEGRVILDTRHVADEGGGEAAVAVDSFASLAPLAPGVQAVIYDMALRGVHIDRIMRELGWLVVNKVPAKKKSRRRGQRGGDRVDKEGQIEIKDVTMGNGSVVPVPIYYKDGRAAVAGRLDETGNATLIFLGRDRTQRFANKTGFRWYSQYLLPTEYGGGQITLRHLGNKEDATKKFNRTENFRVIPRGDPDFDRLYARRGDAESINRLLEDTLYWNRAHSVGHLRQEADLLGFALMVNSLTLARHRAREAVKAAA